MSGLLGGLLFMGLGLMAVSWLVRGLFGWMFRPRPWYGGWGWFGRPMMWGNMWRGGYGRGFMGPVRTAHPMGGMNHADGPGMGGMHRAGGPGMGVPHR